MPDDRMTPATADRLLQRLPPASPLRIDRRDLRTRLTETVSAAQRATQLSRQLKADLRQLTTEERAFVIEMHRHARGLEVASAAWLQDLQHSLGT
jgi:hypothetical protein